MIIKNEERTKVHVAMKRKGEREVSRSTLTIKNQIKSHKYMEYEMNVGMFLK